MAQLKWNPSLLTYIDPLLLRWGHCPLQARSGVTLGQVGSSQLLLRRQLREAAPDQALLLEPVLEVDTNCTHLNPK